jgi:hypothetical protein
MVGSRREGCIRGHEVIITIGTHALPRGGIDFITSSHSAVFNLVPRSSKFEKREDNCSNAFYQQWVFPQVFHRNDRFR